MKQLISTYRFFLLHPLTKKNIFLSILRYIKWQILKKIYPINRYNFIGGTELLLTKNDTSGYGCVYTGLMEFIDQSFLLHFLREDDTFVDVGANTGVYTILASGVCKSNSVSIEPIPETFKKIKNNVINNLIEQKVELLNLGVGSVSKNAIFTNDGAQSRITEFVENSESTVAVEITTIDKLLINRLKSSTLLKIDVEGYELDVLMGSDNLLRNSHLKAIIIEINIPAMESFNYGFDDLNRILEGYGFYMYLYEPFSKDIFKATLEDVLKSSNNGIYIRDIEFVQERIMTSKSFKVLNVNI